MAQLRSSTTAPVIQTTVDAERWWSSARRLFMAHVPGTSGEDRYEAVRDEHGRLTSLGLPIEDRVAALEAFLADHGWLESAHAQIDSTHRHIDEFRGANYG